MSQRKGFSFSHIGLHVRDLAGLKAFYTNYLGFTVTDEGPLPTPGGPINVVFLSRDPETHHQIALIQARPETVEFNVINQISLLADSLDTLLETYKRFAAERKDPIRTVSHGNALSFYTHDPEGNRLELFWHTPWYVTQPLAHEFDFSKSKDEILREAEAHARSLPGFTTRDSWIESMKSRMGVA